MKRLGVLGAGSWGTALAVHAAQNDHEVTLWVRRPELARELEQTRENRIYLKGVALPENLRLSSEIAEMAAFENLLVVVPSHGYREVVRALLPHLPADRPTALVSGAKGIETETLQRMSEVTAEEAAAAGRPVEFAALAGPSFAAELAAGMPTLAVVASRDEAVAGRLREDLASRTFRLYSSTDVIGVELGGTTKNIIAIAAGIVAGLGLGFNTQAALLTRGLHEITRFCVALGGEPRTLAGLAGVGDLVLTCTGGLSRNRQLGMQLAAGKTLKEILAATPMVAEGVRNSLGVARLAARYDVEMPITEQMVEVLYHDKPLRQVIHELMTRQLKSEADL